MVGYWTAPDESGFFAGPKTKPASAGVAA